MVILVTGATGKVGSALAEQLVAQGAEVRAATRQPDAYRGAGKAMAFDYLDEDTWSVLEGVDAFFMNSAGAPPDVCAKFIAYAAEQGIKRGVLMTAKGLEYLPVEAPPRLLEKALMDSGMEWSIVRPTWFMQNFSTGGFGKMVRDGVIRLPAGDGRTAFVDVRDIAAVALEALTQARHNGKGFGVTGSRALDHNEVAAIISAATSKPVHYEPATPEDFIAIMQSYGWDAADAGFLSSIFDDIRDGHAAETTDDVAQVTGKEPITFYQFVQDSLEAW